MKFYLPLILMGAVVTVLGRHSVLGLCIGAGMMMTGWVALEFKEDRA